MRFLILVLFICITLPAHDVYKFGVFPAIPLKKLHEVFSPLSKELEEVVDKPVYLMTKPYFKLYKDELNAGLYDIALIQPFDYIEAHKKQGYIPMARWAEDVTAVLVVSKASSYKRVEDLKGRVIASASPGAAVTYMMFDALKKEGYGIFDDFSISYSKNHFVCLQKLLKAEAAACITTEIPLKYFNHETHSDDFRVIYETKALPHVLFVVHPRVAKKIRDKFQKRILSWKENAKSISILGKPNTSYFIKTRDSEYDRVREFIRLKR